MSLTCCLCVPPFGRRHKVDRDKTSSLTLGTATSPTRSHCLIGCLVAQPKTLARSTPGHLCMCVTACTNNCVCIFIGTEEAVLWRKKQFFKLGRFVCVCVWVQSTHGQPAASCDLGLSSAPLVLPALFCTSIKQDGRGHVTWSCDPNLKGPRVFNSVAAFKCLQSDCDVVTHHSLDVCFLFSFSSFVLTLIYLSSFLLF